MKTRRPFTVERLESRETPSGMLLSAAHVATPAFIRGIEDPNILRSVPLPAVQAASACPSDPSVARAFNPQPDPPTRAAIIAILRQSGVVHGFDAAAPRGIIAI